MSDYVVIVALTLGTVAGVGAIGLLVLGLLRRRSLGWQLLVLALMPVLAVASAVSANVGLMFISGHDSAVVDVALVTGLALALLGTWVVLRRLMRSSSALGSWLGLLVADGDRREPAGDLRDPLPRELELVRREVEAARATLAESRARERNAERARQELVTFLSHDLRTPLAGLRALIEGIEDGVVADVPHALGQLRSTVARMTGLVEDLFDLSRSHPGTADVPRRPVSVTELVGDVAEQQSHPAFAAGVTLEVSVPPSDRLAVSGDAESLGRAFANVLANAVRHTGTGGTVTITADRAEDGHVHVLVLDGCGGIPEAQLSRVFDTGWRGSTARTSDRPGQPVGAGLGLTITQRVLSAHDGSIEVHNVAGGCCFRLQLPVGPSGA